MTPSRTFLRITGACGLVAGLATFLLSLLPWIYGDPATLEARLALHDNSLYQLRLWLSFLNVFFVVLASWGLTFYKWSSAPARASTGMLFLFFYAVAELLGRSIMIFVREYRWTAQLEDAPTPEARASLLQAITRFDEIFGGLFVLLLICFFVSSLCFGSATSGGAGLERWVSRLLFLASALALVTLLALFIPSPVIRGVATWGYPIVQPLSRFMVGLWLWRAGGSAQLPRG